jgi:hypothetical protein
MLDLVDRAAVCLLLDLILQDEHLPFQMCNMGSELTFIQGHADSIEHQQMYIANIASLPIIIFETQFQMFKQSAFLATTGLLLCSIPWAPSLAKPQIMQETITVGDVKAAQEGWCNAVTALSKTYAESGFEASKRLASEVVDSAYGYQFGPVSFKPTWAYGETTFRPTKEGAVSYFVGGNPKYRDPGFTIASPGDGNYPNLQNRSQWVKCIPEIVTIQVFGNTATAMGWVRFEAADGYQSKVDKTFGYMRDDSGNLRIIVHHSSTPYKW